MFSCSYAFSGLIEPGLPYYRMLNAQEADLERYAKSKILDGLFNFSYISNATNEEEWLVGRSSEAWPVTILPVTIRHFVYT